MIEAVILGVAAITCSTAVQAGMLMRVRARPEFWYESKSPYGSLISPISGEFLLDVITDTRGPISVMAAISWP